MENLDKFLGLTGRNAVKQTKLEIALTQAISAAVQQQQTYQKFLEENLIRQQVMMTRKGEVPNDVS